MVISTERLILRSFKPEDAQGLYRLLSNSKVHCFCDEILSDISAAEDQAIEKSKIQDCTDLAVCLRDGTFIGELFGCSDFAGGSGSDTFSPCWNFIEEYCGKGYAFEAVKAWFDYLFNQMQFRRIYAYTEDNNFSSQKLCRRLGMRHEGTFKEFISFVSNPDGTPLYENTMQFAILKREWDQLRKPYMLNN